MTKRERPFRLEIEGEFGTYTYKTLDAAKAAAALVAPLQRWRIRRQDTRYGKRELVDAGTWNARA